MKGLIIRYENLYNKGEIPLQYGLNVKRYAMKKLKNFDFFTTTATKLITDSTTKDTTKNLISSRTIATNSLTKLFGVSFFLLSK
jgi:hypothetical protein